jgi:hypothetical protein
MKYSIATRLIKLAFICACILLPLPGCKKKNMAKKETLETWLERHFPDQFDVDRNLRDLQPRHFFEKKITSIVSAKADSIVQFEVTWYKTMEGLGINVEEITELAERRKAETAKAREWYKVLEQNGLQRFSVGVIEQAMYILPYGPADPTTRLRNLEIVMKALDSGHGDQTSIFIQCMEDSTYREEIGEIIPFGYWRRKDTYHDDHNPFKIDFEYSGNHQVTDINDHWQFNTMSKRSHGFRDRIFPDVEKWANANLKPPYYVEPDQYISYEMDDKDMLSVHYSFPLFPEKPNYEVYGYDEKRMGYITGKFHSDKLTFTDIKKVDDL